MAGPGSAPFAGKKGARTSTVVPAHLSVMPARLSVMPALEAGIHANWTRGVFAWMAGSGPAMTERVVPD